MQHNQADLKAVKFVSNRLNSTLQTGDAIVVPVELVEGHREVYDTPDELVATRSLSSTGQHDKMRIMMSFHFLKYMPRIRQIQTDGSSVEFPMECTTKKTQRIDFTQAAVVNDIMNLSVVDPELCLLHNHEVSLPTFFYQTGSVMAVVFDLRKIATLCRIISES